MRDLPRRVFTGDVPWNISSLQKITARPLLSGVGLTQEDAKNFLQHFNKP